MRPMSRFFIERPRFAAVVSIVLSLLGAVSLMRLPVAQYPEVMPPSVSVTCSYPGSNTRELMYTVAAVIEEEVNGVEGMIYMFSTMSDDGTYSFSVTFDSGTDRDVALMKVQTRVQQAMSRLPIEVRDCGITVNCASIERLGMINLWSKGGGIGRLEISDYVFETLRPELQRIHGVGGVETDGQRKAIRVWIDPLRCAAQSISSSEIVDVIRRQNVQATIGTAGRKPAADSHQLVTLMSKGRLSSPEEFGEMIVKRDGGNGIVRLKDVARIEEGEQEYGAYAVYNNHDMVSVDIYRLPDCNAVEIMDDVRARMAELSKHFPGDLDWSVSYDVTDYIRASISETVSTLLLTVVLVAFVCWLFLQSWRAMLVPVVTIPVSILSTFTVMAVLGYSVNILTMFGLILAIGTVVDDAIVVVERVQYLMARGMNAREAAISAMNDVTGAVVATTLVLLGIFVPIAFLNGMTSMIYRQFAITISASVAFSAVCALTLSPALCAVLMRNDDPHRRKWKPLQLFEKALDRVCTRYAVLSSLFVRRPLAVLAIIAAAALWTVHLGRTLPDSFIPVEDQGVINVDVHLPDGYTRAGTESVCKILTDRFNEVDGVQGVIATVGKSCEYGICENLADVIVVLDPWADRKRTGRTMTKIIADIREIARKVPAADIFTLVPAAIPGMGFGGTVRPNIVSDNLDWHAMIRIVEKVGRELAKSPLIGHIFCGSYDTMPYCYFDVNRAKCESYRVPLASLYATLQQYVGSLYVNDVNLGNQVNRVIVQADARGRDSVEGVCGIYVKSEAGAMIPVDALVTPRMVSDGRVCWRFDKRLVAGFTCVPAEGVSSGEAMKECRRIMEETLPDGYMPVWLNQSWFEDRERGMALPIMLLAVVFGYLFLVAQYESWMIPVPVMLSVVVAMLGALLGLQISGEPASAFSRLGMILLIGLSAKNAILIVEFSKEAHDREGLPVTGAATVGVIERFRAVMMTAFTFVLGILPLVWAEGAGANARRSIGVTTLAGMLASTLVGVLLVPSLYAIFQRLCDSPVPAPKK